MTDYTKLVRALRCCCPQPEETCDGCPYDTAGECNISRMMFDAAAAIETLEAAWIKSETDATNLTGRLAQAEADVERLNLEIDKRIATEIELSNQVDALQAEQKKIVTQIFGEEQMAWEGRCKDLMKHISDLQAEIRESMQKCAECGDAQEQKVKGLQAEVERLKDSNEELRDKQTYIDHYGDKWQTSAKDVPTAAYEHGYADGRDEAEAQLPKHGEWVRVEDGESYHYECSRCGERPLYSRYGDVVLSGVCPMCGAKMEVQK